MRNSLIQWVLTLTIAFWRFGSPRNSNFQSGSSFGSVRAHSLTLSCTPRSIKCDSQASYLARTVTSLALVASSRLGLWQNMGGLQLFKEVLNVKTMLKWMLASWEMPWLCTGRMIKRLLITLMPNSTWVVWTGYQCTMMSTITKTNFGQVNFKLTIVSVGF
jgi:hypothetical protein